VDKDKAAQLYGQAAEQGDADAQWFLGLCYEHGHGVPYDMGVAVALYRQAIDGGCVEVNASLGLCFEKGRGMVQSTAEAEGLYKLAAKSGSSTLDALPRGLGSLLRESLSPNAAPDTPSAAARARIQFAVYSLNLSARQGRAAAEEQLKLLAGRRYVVSACCVGCGAVRKLKTCAKCRITRFCDKECTARMWPAHKASCKAWRAESAADAEQTARLQS
jgi:TPR repeat protein